MARPVVAVAGGNPRDPLLHLPPQPALTTGSRLKYHGRRPGAPFDHVQASPTHLYPAVTQSSHVTFVPEPPGPSRRGPSRPGVATRCVAAVAGPAFWYGLGRSGLVCPTARIRFDPIRTGRWLDLYGRVDQRGNIRKHGFSDFVIFTVSSAAARYASIECDIQQLVTYSGVMGILGTLVISHTSHTSHGFVAQ